MWVRQSATGQLRERMLLRQRKMEDKQMLAEGREAEDGERKEKIRVKECSLRAQSLSVCVSDCGSLGGGGTARVTPWLNTLCSNSVCALVGSGVTRIIYTVDIYYINYTVTLHNFYNKTSNVPHYGHTMGHEEKIIFFPRGPFF